ncbi:MAG: outer membrane protein assembly factor BamD [Neisseriaceae bacterium]
MYIFRKLLLIVIILVVLASCADDSDPLQVKGKSGEEIYTEANTALNNSTYDKAIKLYNALETSYPYGVYAQQGMLELSYAYYEYDQYENALATIDQFINTYPTNPNIDYALYLKGYINYRHDDSFFAKITKQDASELDPEGLRAAHKSFTELITQYPKSAYVSDAQNKINQIVMALAKSEIIKARYYMEIKAYLAAINRANTVITTYSTTNLVEEALAIEVVAYQELGMSMLSKDIYRVLALNYPNSKYLKNRWVYIEYPWYKIY